ncbi:MAG: hypothetical protein P8L37_00875 [Phycisphaerales bacterium]|nr:hypothetical protein [Phycisphaerales bacterium]
MRPQSTTSLLYGVMLLTSFGCHVNRADTSAPVAETMRTTAAEVQLTGPCSVASDGSIIWTAVPRPDGDLLSTQVKRQLAAEDIDAWARATTSKYGGATGRLRSIVGPYRINPDDATAPVMYDVTLEVWTDRAQ